MNNISLLPFFNYLFGVIDSEYNLSQVGQNFLSRRTSIPIKLNHVIFYVSSIYQIMHCASKDLVSSKFSLEFTIERTK